MTPGYRLHPRALVVGIVAFLLPFNQVNAQQNPNERLAQIEQLDRTGEFATALRLLRTAHEEVPEDYQVLCWMAEILVDSTEVTARHGLETEAKALSEESIVFAREAVRVNPEGADGWFQLGQTLGVSSDWAGPSEAVTLARETKAAFEEAISLDPFHASALHGLAKWHRSVANTSRLERISARLLFGGLPPATIEEAISLFQQAIEIEPEVIAHHLELAKTYSALEQFVPARTELEIIRGLPEATHGDQERKAEARRLEDHLAPQR